MTGSPRRLTPGNAIAALAILAGVALVLFRFQSAEDASAPETERATIAILELQTKLLTGVARIDPGRALAELAQFEGFKDSPAARRGLAAFHAYLQPPGKRDEALLELPLPEDRTPLDRLVASAISDPYHLTDPERAVLLDQMSWFGRLLLASSDPESAQRVASESLKAMAVASAASLLLALALGTGFVLLLMGLIRRRQGNLPFRLQPAPERCHLYFQAFAIYLWGMILFSSLAPWFGLTGSAVAIALSLLLAISYPLLRGLSFRDWQTDLGFHCGRGFFREAAAGIAAYLAMLPLLALGLALTLFLQKLDARSTGEAPSPISHPIYGMIPGASTETILLLFLVASVLGPLAEEAMFRGALYGALRGFAGRVLSLFLMSFIFAAVHPQGVFAIPSLMAVAISFGIMREWRSSLVAGAVAHGLHNGALLLGMTVLLS